MKKMNTIFEVEKHFRLLFETVCRSNLFENPGTYYESYNMKRMMFPAKNGKIFCHFYIVSRNVPYTYDPLKKESVFVLKYVPNSISYYTDTIFTCKFYRNKFSWIYFDGSDIEKNRRKLISDALDRNIFNNYDIECFFNAIKLNLL